MHYNLITEPWIPIIRHNGEAQQIGLQTLFEEASNIREIYADTPLETVAINRLLIALYLDMFPEQLDETKWQAQLLAQHFDKATVSAYFIKYAECFDLLHPERPFYQSTKLLKDGNKPEDITPIGKLFMEEGSSGGKSVFYTHTHDIATRMIPLDKAARLVLSFQNFAIGGGVSKPFNFANASMVGSLTFWIRGENLLESLLHNAPPREECRKMGELEDAPCWRSEAREWDRHTIRGYMDYLTWQPRGLRLIAQEKEGQTFITSAVLHQGNYINTSVIDPFFAYKKSKKEGQYSLGVNADKALWRDATVFMSVNGDEKFAPNNLKALASSPEKKWEIDVFGMANDQGTVVFLKQERMPVYTCFLQQEIDHDYFVSLDNFIEDANQQKDILRNAIKIFCSWLLANSTDGSIPKADATAVGKLIDHTQGISQFWASLETPFYEFMEQLAFTETNQERKDLEKEWGERIYKVALNVYQEITQSFQASGRHLRAAAEGQRFVMRVKSLRIEAIKDKDERKKRKDQPKTNPKSTIDQPQQYNLF